MIYPVLTSSNPDHQLLAALMDSIPDRIYFKDRQGRFLLVNKALLEFHHLGRLEDVLGKTDFDLFLPTHASEALADEQHVLGSGTAIVGKVEMEDFPDGRVRWSSTTKVPMRSSDGAISGTCGISRDVTAEHQKNEQLRQYSLALAEKQHQIDQELALARQVQMALLPQQYPVYSLGAGAPSVVRFAHRYLPAAQLGGDYFNIISVSRSKVGMLICDVMGHGVHAALVTALQRVLVEDLHRLTGNPSEFLGELNRRLCSFFQPLESSMYVTAYYILLDVSTGEIKYANAGHPPALHLARGEGVRLLPGTRGGMALALGIDSDTVYTTETGKIQPGDALVVYTDGVSDIHSETEHPFLDMVKKCSPLKGNAFLDGLLAEANTFNGPDGFFDDVCIVTLELEELLVRPA